MVDGKYGFAVIGYGGMGSYHIRKIQEKLNNHAVVCGIYDINPERGKIAQDNGIHSYASREELLNDERIDLITVATPNDYHKEIVIDCLKHGKNVISEKPVTLCSADLEEMIAAAEKYGKIFTVHQNRRWDPDYLTMKKVFDENMLSNTFRIESRVQGSRGIPGDWRNQPEHGGGMLFDWGIHLLDQCLMMTNPRKIVSVYNEFTYVTNEKCDDGFRATINFDDGLSYYIEVTTSNFISLPRWYMLGENGSAVLTDWDCSGKIVMVTDWENKDAVPIEAGVGLTKTMAPRDKDAIEEYPLPVVESDWTEYYKNIFAAIDGKEDYLITHEQQRRLIKLVEALFESAEKNKVVELNL